MPNTVAIANVFKLIEEYDIKFVLLRFTDIKGKEHGVSLPLLILLMKIYLKTVKCSTVLPLKDGRQSIKQICS